MLTFLFTFLGFVILSLFFIHEENKIFLRTYSIFCASVAFLVSLFTLIRFNSNYSSFQFVTHYNLNFEFINVHFAFGLDGISLFLFLLTTLLILVCIIFVLYDDLLKYYLINLFFIELLLLLVFSTLDLLLFYIFFEAILIPMYLIVGIWGSRDRKIRAVYMLFFYTLIGSLLMLLGIIYIFNLTGSLSLEYLFCYEFTFKEQCWLWLAFFLSFASKIPVFPLHIWLPEAHVEAPTVGSVLLAGILLKLGTYGFIRFSLTMFPDASVYFSPFVFLLCTLGVIFASLSAIRQTDMKRIIAYSSIAHMNLITLGLFSFNLLGLEGALLQSISHGFVSGALFFLVGVLYDRYGTRTIFYYGGLAQVMPVYTTLLFIFTLSNIAIPGTSSFVGEFLLLIGVFKVDALLCFVVALGVILGGSYSLWLYNRLAFGSLRLPHMTRFNDLTVREFLIFVPLLALVFLMGLHPSFFSQHIQASIPAVIYATSF